METWTQRRSSRGMLAMGLLGVGTLLAACDPPGPTTPAATRASGSERTSSTDTTPLPEDALAREGHTHFDRACARCHTGDEPSGGALANRRLTLEQVEGAIFAGSDNRQGIMAVVPPDQLTVAQVPALVAYLRTIRTVR